MSPLPPAPSRRRAVATRLRAGEPAAWLIGCVLVVTLAAAAFLGPALARSGGLWPAPLDDVYIYFGFARSLSLGHGLSWVPGNGYSSGATSLLYPVLLAPAWLCGLRGSWLGVWASLLAIVLLVDLARSLRRIVASRLVSWLVPLLLVSVPLLDWSWFSGMETALFGAVLGRALRAAWEGCHAEALRRATAQLRAGGWLAALLLVRPEAAVLALPLSFLLAWRARALSAVGTLARALGPAVAVAALVGFGNAWLTGELAPAGAVRKLLTSNPHLDPTAIAIELLKNLVVLEHQAFVRALGGATSGLLVPLLLLVAVLGRRHRGLALALVASSAGVLVAVSLNSTARFQNYRYAAPALAMLLVGAGLGLDTLAGWLAPGRASRRRRLVGLGVVGAAGLAACVAPLRELRGQTDHFGRASRNIAEQQIEVARRLARIEPRPRRVLVGDAGAIPYFSELPALDGLGLGGFHRLPFARASVHGVPAVVELIERLGDDERPDLMALYPGWWPGLVEPFGSKRDAVRITDNVICAADEKVIYDVDWSLLADAGELRANAVDELDVGDLVDELEHEYRLPSPRGGWITAAVHELDAREPGTPTAGKPRGRPHHRDRPLRWDAGRVAPAGSIEHLRVRAATAHGAARLVMRTVPETSAKLRVSVWREGTELQAVERVVVASKARGSSEASTRAAASAALAPNRWREIEVSLADAGAGDYLRIAVLEGEWRSYHLWLVRP